MDPYQTRALEGASGVELIIALYDGIIRFMRIAIDAVEGGDEVQRRYAVKRAMDIVIHLQATLKMDIGGEPAQALAEFYTAMFALMLQGSQANSREKFEQVISGVRNVREAWVQVARDPDAIQTTARAGAMSGYAHQAQIGTAIEAAASSSWTA